MHPIKSRIQPTTRRGATQGDVPTDADSVAPEALWFGGEFVPWLFGVDDDDDSEERLVDKYHGYALMLAYREQRSEQVVAKRSLDCSFQ